jgi:excisionase family DNA binding protein
MNIMTNIPVKGANETRRSPSAAFKTLDPRVRPVVPAYVAFDLLGIDRTTGYKAIRAGTFPVPAVRIGRLIRIPTAALVRLLQAEQLPPVGIGQE